ncbi:hypothetical protein OU564_20145, partial [Escherichia coli]|nr:hypothetical protein [Escherichia coli]MDF8607170.1 hypothetical protein [Escherichia coli]
LILDGYSESSYSATPRFAAARLPWFARLTGVQPAQVTQWINKGFIVVNHTLYSPRRKLGI